MLNSIRGTLKRAAKVRVRESLIPIDIRRIEIKFVKNVVKEHDAILKYSSNRKPSKAHQERIDAFVSKLDTIEYFPKQVYKSATNILVKFRSGLL